MAEVSFTMAASDDTILLPRNAVIEKDNETYVYLINNGKAKRQQLNWVSKQRIPSKSKAG